MMTYLLVASAIIWSTRKDPETRLEGIGIGNTELCRHKSTRRESRYRYGVWVYIVGTERGCIGAYRSDDSQSQASSDVEHDL